MFEGAAIFICSVFLKLSHIWIFCKILPFYIWMEPICSICLSASFSFQICINKLTLSFSKFRFYFGWAVNQPGSRHELNTVQLQLGTDLNFFRISEDKVGINYACILTASVFCIHLELLLVLAELFVLLNRCFSPYLS